MRFHSSGFSFTYLTLPAGQFVTNLYEGFLQRGPDADGLAHWTTQAGTTAQSRQNVLNAFAGCDPFRALAGALYRETFWLVSDHLGTPRMVVDRTGSLAGVKRHDYLPFGEELGAYHGGRNPQQGYGALDNVRRQFTGYERDDETGLDYAQARYYANSQGRFTGADPLFITGGRLGDPQQLNLYAYARNNPLKYTDPTGLDVSLEGTEKEAYINGLNTRDDRKFTVKNSDNKVRIVDAKGNALGKAAWRRCNIRTCVIPTSDQIRLTHKAPHALLAPHFRPLYTSTTLRHHTVSF